ncbi:RNA binding protein, heterogenous nuclear RNP-K like protein [Coemansia sp. BCRC 34301]|nr:RNA binding protein, heterogenous nuclear RNP-K like protein [Coemansia sp. BCRC 34301]
MSDESGTPELCTISTTPAVSAQSAPAASYFATGGTAADASNSNGSAKGQGSSALSTSRKKRGRKASVQNNRPPSVGPDSEDINIHVEAGWSEDEADAKEHPTKRAATSVADNDAAAIAKRAAGPLASFTVRAVVTRKDIEVVFGHGTDKQEHLETTTGAKIEIVTGRDDPDIVVDRILSIKGHIDGVAAAYKGVVDGMLLAKAAAAASTIVPTSADADVSASASTFPESPSPVAEAEGDEARKGAAHAKSPEQDAGANSDTASANGADETSRDRFSADKPDNDPDNTTAGRAASKLCTTLRILVPHKCVGSIMGHGGKTINNIRDITTVSIHTSEATLPLSTERIVELIGTPESIRKAIVLVAEALTRDMTSYTSADHYVPAANLPSAMTMEIHNRKRKDGRRLGAIDTHSGNRNQASNRGSGPRSSGGYSQSRGQGVFSHNASNSGMGGGINNRGDRYNRHGDRYGDRCGDRQGGRNRGPSSTSQVNRVPVGGGGGGRSQGHSYTYNSNGSNNNGGYRMGSQLTPTRNAAPSHTLNYGGYAVPAPTAYPTYGAPNSSAAGHMGGGVVPPAMRYGAAMPPLAPGPARGAYTSSYDAAPPSYPYPAPSAYGYGAAAAPQGMYHGALEQPAGVPYSQGYAVRHNRPQMPQSMIPMGGASGSVSMGGAGNSGGGAPASSAGQTIQQIYVPGDKIGAVIGRRGETINEIRRSTNAHVDIQDSGPGAKQRLIVITGGYDQVRSAYYMIKNKVDMARPAVHP